MCLISTVYVQGIVMCISIGVLNIVLNVYSGVVLCIGIVSTAGALIVITV